MSSRCPSVVHVFVENDLQLKRQDDQDQLRLQLSRGRRRKSLILVEIVLPAARLLPRVVIRKL